MRADNTAYLAASAKERSDATMARALAAIESVERTRVPVTLSGLARSAGVSRAWIYAQPGLRARLQPLLTSSPSVGSSIPVTQRASDASLRNRLELALRRNRDLARENAQLRSDLENALTRIRLTP